LEITPGRFAPSLYIVNKLFVPKTKAMSPSKKSETHRLFHHFDRSEWKNLSSGFSRSLSPRDPDRLRGLNEPLTMGEIEDVYFPLANLLDILIGETRRLHARVNGFLGKKTKRLPYIIGIAGSVAVGKSTTARVLQKVLSMLPNRPKVDLVTTDGFLYPNRTLIARNILNRKGFPESYDAKSLLRFLSAMKAGADRFQVPVYSHLEYDVLENETQTVERPDVLIVEGINVLQVDSTKEGNNVFVSDYFDYSIYVDAHERDIMDWYVRRFESLRATAFQDPSSYFHRYAGLGKQESTETAARIWNEINRPNLLENILPTRYRADLILEKGPQHFVKAVRVRKM